MELSNFQDFPGVAFYFQALTAGLGGGGGGGGGRLPYFLATLSIRCFLPEEPLNFFMNLSINSR